MIIENEVRKAISFYSKKKFSSALKIYRKIISLEDSLDGKTMGVIYYNAGLCWFSLYNWVTSEYFFRKAEEHGFKECGYEISMSLLHQGKIKNGMALFHKRDFGNRKKSLDLPIVRINSIDQCLHKKLLVLNEEGLGDEILFSQFIRHLDNKCSEVWYQVYPQNLELFKKIFTDTKINFFEERTLSSEFVNSFDCYGYSGDFFADGIIKGEAKSFFGEKKHEKEEIKKVGVLWHTNKISKNTEERSFRIEDLAFLKNKGIEVVNLQYGERVDWMENPQIESMLDVYLQIDQVDLVITPDTSIAHLSCSMGVETIVAHKDYIDWRWSNEFYPGRYELVNVKYLDDYLFG